MIRMLMLLGGLLASQSAFAEIKTCVNPPFSSVRVLPTMTIGKLDCAARISSAGAPGQIVNTSFVLQSETAVTGLTLTASALTSGTSTLSAGAVDIRYVKVWYQAGSAWGSIHQDRSAAALVPELLLHDADLIRTDSTQQENLVAIGSGSSRQYRSLGSRSDNTTTVQIIAADALPIADRARITAIDVPANFRQQIWLTFKLPAEATPGRYKGIITLRANSARTEIPIELDIHPFTLAPPVLTYSLYYRGVLAPNGKGSISSELKSRRQMEAELHDMRAHGIDNPTIYQSADSLELLDEVLRLRASAGFSNETIYWLGIQSGSVDQRSALLAAARKRFEAHGVQRIFVYAIDEAAFSDVSRQKGLWDRYRQQGAEIFAADYKAGFESHYAGKVPLVISGVRASATSNAKLQASGTKVFSYNQPQVGVENPEVYRRNYGIQAWRLGFDGVMNYAYQHAMGNIWNDFDHPKFRDHNFAYPTADGVIPTLAWEGFRAAVDDVRYLSTLQSIATALNSRDDINHLARLKSSGTEDLDQMRAELARRIERLCTSPAARQQPYCIVSASPPSSPTIRQSSE